MKSVTAGDDSDDLHTQLRNIIRCVSVSTEDMDSYLKNRY